MERNECKQVSGGEGIENYVPSKTTQDAITVPSIRNDKWGEEGKCWKRIRRENSIGDRE